MKSSMSISMQPKVGFCWAMWLLFSHETSVNHHLSGRLAVYGFQSSVPSSSQSETFLRSKRSGWASSQTRCQPTEMSATYQNIPYDDPPHIPNEEEKTQRKQMERKQRRRDGPSPPQHKFSLNNEIHGLRRQKNGIPLAEQRLQNAIEEMLKEAENKPGLPRVLHMPPETSTLSSSREQEVVPIVRTDEDSRMRSRFPDVVSFNSIIISHAKNSPKDRFAARKAEGWLRKMHELSSGEAGFAHLKPNTFTYNAVMEAYFNTRSSGGGLESAGLSETKQQSINRLYQEVQQISYLSPTTYTRNIVLASQAPDSENWILIESWANASFSINATSKGSQQDASHTVDLVPDRQTFNTLLKRYAEIGDAAKAETLLQKLLRLYRDQKLLGDRSSLWLEPSKVWFHCVLRALAASKDVCAINSEERAGYVLQEMKHLYFNERLDDLLPDTSTFNHVMNIYALCGNFKGALHLLEEMEESFSSSGKENQQPDCVTYTTVIKAYATAQQNKSLSKDLSSVYSVESGMGLLQRMRKRSVHPSIVTYNTLLNMWTIVGSREALQQAENLLREVKYPDSISLSTLIHGWARSRLPEAGFRAQALFNELLQLPPSRKKKNFNVTTLCNSVISAFVKSGEQTAPERAESLLSLLEGRYYSGDFQAAPDKTTFLCVIDAYAKVGIVDAEERCDALLNRMHYIKDNFQLKDLEADRAVYNAILNALAKSLQSSAVQKSEEILTMMETSPDPTLRPDIVTYSTVVDCHTKCGESSGERSEEILRYVEGTYRSGDMTLKPNAIFYSAILQSWAKTASVEGAKKARNLLQRNAALYEEGKDWAKPHSIVFNAVMDAIARSGLEDSGRLAEDLLDEMESLYQAGDEDMRPSRRSFNAVMMAYRKEGNASKAEDLLYRMEEMAESKGRPEVKPNVVSYNTVIGAIVEDSSCGDIAADRAQALLDRMESRNIRPDGRSYSAVIEAWLQRNDEKGTRIAEALLSQFLEQVQESKKGRKMDNNNLYEREVWDVVNAYRKKSTNTITSHIF